MAKIRVLIVDDSVVIRRLLSTHLATDPAIDVVGTAADGEIGLAKISHLQPDLVVLDLEMPVLDGMQTLTAIRKLHGKLPVIVFSTLTERGATATLNALAAGANDYATKPSSGTSALQHICSELIPRIKALCPGMVTAVEPEKVPVPLVARIAQTAKPAATPTEILAVGASTGGPNALASLVAGLDRKLPVPVVIVQHMPEIFTRLLAERLGAISGFRVSEGRAGELLRAGEIWIAPGGHHMEVAPSPEGPRLRIHKGPLENSCRPAVDVLFRSVAQVYGAATLGVVLTGMGHDGLRGCELIDSNHGRVLAQDEATSVVWGMPGAVSKAGLAEKILPLHNIASEVNRILSVRPAARGKRSLLAAMAPTSTSHVANI